MKKRLLSIILTLCMVLTLLPTAALAGTVTDYGIWVGTTNVTSENASNVTGDGTVTYDADTDTLTLNNASITETGLYGYAIGRYPGDLKIALIGKNTIDLSSVASRNGAVIGIYSSQKLSIKSTAGGSLSIVSAPTTQGTNTGISGSGGVTIEGCTVTATVGAATGPLDPACHGITVANGILSIKNATVTADGGTTAGNSHGINVDNGSLVIDNSTVTASGGAGTFSSYGIKAATTTITISASTVTATGNTSALYFGGAPTVTGLTATASTDKTGDGASAVAIDSSVYGSGSTYRYVKIAPALPSQQARWGEAGSDGAKPAAWTYGTLDDAMSYANGLVSGTAYIQLLSDVNITAALVFESDKTTILDLNGKDIDRGLTAKIADGNVINVSGSLTLKDSSTDTVASQGKITGGYSSAPGFLKAYDGGCVDINASASFTMQGGNITGNKTTYSGVGGGGVFVGQNGSFIMTGGSIADNEALYWGGGVYVSGSFTMLGGSITGNKSANGGVYFNSTNFTVGGTAVIDNNTVSGSSVERNVMLTGKTISVHSTTPLASGASIGVTAKTAPTSGSPGNVTGTNSANYSAYFFSDNSSYIIQNGANNVVQLAVAPLTISTLAISGSFTAGHNLALSDLDSYKPTVTANGVTITAEGWQLYNPSGGGYWQTLESGGSITPDTGSASTLRYYATYSGGTVYSNAVTLNVVGNTTALALTASPASPQSAGTQVTLTATLTGFFTGAGVNNQTITFKNGSTTLGTAKLDAAGVASYTWTPGTGTYSLTAEYAATAYNKAATSDALSYTVGTAPLPTAAEYAADAVSGTDYVLNTTDKTLTVKTAKGAAFWSASGTSYLDYTVLLENTLDVSGFSWTPVGAGYNPFTGTFDGQNHTLQNLTVTTPNGFYAGVFGSVESGGVVKNLTVSGSVNVDGGNHDCYAGGIVGYNDSGIIDHCVGSAKITVTTSGSGNQSHAGGIAGFGLNGIIRNCQSSGEITAVSSYGAYAGGISGSSIGGSVQNCWSTGAVSAGGGNYGNFAGGIVGYGSSEAAIANCYSTGTVTASNANAQAGGICGAGGTINCYYKSDAAGTISSTVQQYYSDTATACGTFEDNGGTLTAGTAVNCGSAQTLAYGTTLLTAMNGWVTGKDSSDYCTWQADTAGSPVNGGYPVFGAAWVASSPLALTGVGCDVAARKLTGTTVNMQYSLDGGTTWQDCAADNTAGLTFAAGTVKVRQKDKATNERTVITIAAPAASNAPTLESKTSDSVILTSMAGYEYSRDGGVTWQDSNSFSGLSSSTLYSFVARIKATAATLPGTVSTALPVTTSSASSGDGTGSGSGSSTSGTGAPVIVDGKTQNIGTEKKFGDTTTVTVDQSKLSTNIGGAASGSSVVVPVSENGSATASLVVKNIEDMAAKSMTLTVQTGSVAYNLNTSAIDTAALAAAFPGADMSTVPFNVTISNSSVSVEGETLVLSPVAFTVTATYGGKTVDVDTFSTYIDRVIEVTAEQAAKITTAVVVNADGSVRHVPTNVIEKDGKYYAVINSRTNSTYALIQNEVTFADAEGKWYEAAVNEMGSRKIIEGRSASVFDGEASITRAEFASILIRALGLPTDGASTFSDVPTDAWYCGAVATAVQYGITDGRGNGRFDPSAAITRQEAMLMLQRAAALTGFTGTSGNLDSFADAGSVGSWALDAAKWSVGSGLIQGTDGKLNPTANITRAESATIILRLLQKAGLVDVRSKT